MYSVKSRDFPWIDLRPGQPIYVKTTTREFSGDEGATSDQEETDSAYWLDERDARRWQLWEEVFVQANGYRMTLLNGEFASDD